MIKRLSAKARIAMGMAMLVVTMLMLASMAGLIPDPRPSAMQSRCAISELIALQIRPVIVQEDLRRMEGLLEAAVRRNDEILSGAVRRNDGKLVVEVGDHRRLWDAKATVSDDRQVYVPLKAAGENWGRVEICFQPLTRRGWIGLLDSPAVKLITLTGLMCWVLFYLYLRKMLSHLDPSRAVPGRVRNALDTLGDGLLVLDRESRIVLVNRSLAESIGQPPEKIVGLEAARLPWLRDEMQQEKGFPWVRAIKEAKSVQGETLRFHRDDADDAVFLTSCSPVPGSDGSPQGVLVSLDDVTELEETKQQLSCAKDAAEEANHAKSAFLANMSHEIRTPMNAILGFTEVLRRGLERDESKRKKHLNTIHSSGTHLLNLINDILDLSKVEADRLEVEAIPCAVHRVIADVVTVMGVRAEEKKISLEYQFDGKIPETITSDPARLRQILTNLVGNAIKFTSEGGVRVICRLDTEHERPQMVIQVVDTGIGMTSAAAAKIFDPFSQADASVTRKFGGTGLGLSISKRFAEALGGSISVQSEEGKGSVFIVTIDTGPLDGVPLIEPDDEDLESPLTEETSGGVQLSGLRVLLVDDGEENRDLMSLILRDTGAIYATAGDGVEAIEAANKQSWDVILMDMQMPVMDGYTATRKLREQGYDKPIVALTAHAMKDAEQECRDAGCDGFLSKPIEFDKLTSILAEYAAERKIDSQPDLPAPVETDVAIPNASLTPTAGPDHTPGNDDHTSGNDEQTSGNDDSPIRSTLAAHGDTFASIINNFAERLPEKIDSMQTALDRRELSELANLAHWLKGSGPNVGFTELGEPALRLEQAARGADTESAAAIISELQAMVARIERVPEPLTAPNEAPHVEPASPETESTTPMFSGPDDPVNSQQRETNASFDFEQIDAQFEAMEDALRADDAVELAAAAGKLKQRGGELGSREVRTLAKTIELFAGEGDLELIPQLIEDMRQLRNKTLPSQTAPQETAEK